MKLDFDPEIDPPATIAVLGAGPVGIEAALYARILGYSVFVVDGHTVGGSLRPWSSWPLPCPWDQLASSVGLAALEAQGKQLPGASQNDGSEIPSYQEYLSEYLLPLARTDLLRDSILIQSKVRSISRLGCAITAGVGPHRRAELEFRLLIDSERRGAYSQQADIILDCSGLARRAGMAPGGGLASGEVANSHSRWMHLGKCDLLGKDRPRIEDKHCLLWGSNLEACANAIELARLVRESDRTRVTWIVPKRLDKSEPKYAVSNERGSLLEQLEDIEQRQDSRFSMVEAWGIEAVRASDHNDVADPDDEHPPAAPVTLTLQSTIDETLELSGEFLLNCSDRLPDWSLVEPLPAAGLSPAAAGTKPELAGSLTAEPHYYVLGAKSQTHRVAQPSEPFEHPLPRAFEQIRQVFALIGGRTNLNLYETVKPKDS